MEDAVKNLNVSLSCSNNHLPELQALLYAGTKAIGHSGVAEAQGPDNLWAEEEPLGPVLSEVDRVGMAAELPTIDSSCWCPFPLCLRLDVCAWLGA